MSVGPSDSNTTPDPIAIIGIGCRFPGGASNPEAFWDLLKRGGDAIVEVPPERWDARRFYDPDPEKPGKTYVKQGGFLHEKVDYFDPLTFGMSPREAHTLDPQQRLLLEVTWEALEDAGLRFEKLTGSPTGVFIGSFALDMKMLQSNPLNRDVLYSYSTTGASMTLLANRLSYVFDWRGPSLSIDTACSSSLVATHYACQSIWRGECSLAIAGGANVMLRPEYFIVMCKGHYLSPQGRCRAFDSRADGYVRGEGAGVVVLKPLSAALRDRDPIYALIRATGVNQDGQTAGISLPNEEAQERLIASVYQRAGVAPGAVQYIEAHGTGTKAGDPVEARALHRALSVGRDPSDRCVVGSVKTNIGHLEAAAGVAGLIKTTLSLKHKQIPPNLHFERPNPDIPFETMCIRVPTTLETLQNGAKPVYAGVNSFGYGGTNAHVLLESAPAAAEAAERVPDNGPWLVPISARSDQALKALAGNYAAFLSERGTSVSLADLCYTTNLRRSHHYRRAALVASSRDELSELLKAVESGTAKPGLSMNQTMDAESRRLAFVYTGMGPQWWAMGRELLSTEPVFRAKVEECDAVFAKIAGWSILEAMKEPEAASRMAETQVAQPANFVLQAGLSALYESWGIIPVAVVGHSVGEVAAAYVSGALSLEDAVLISYHRSRLQQKRAGLGTMLAVGLAQQEVESLVEPYAGRVDIAAVNGQSSVTIAGEAAALKSIASDLAGRDVFHRFLKVEVAYHSYQMDAVHEDLLASLAAIRPRESRIPLYSTVTGAAIRGCELTPDYWWRNVRQPVLFGKTMQTLLSDNHRTFVEVGPHPVLRNSITDALRASNTTGNVVTSLHRERPERPSMLQAVGALYTIGFSPNWRELVRPEARYIKLPTYPWQREHHWHESTISKEDRLGQQGVSPFLSTPLHLPVPAWEVELNSAFFPYLQDHALDGAVVFPGAGYVEAGLALHRVMWPQQEVCTLENLQFHKLLAVDSKDVTIMHLRYDPASQAYSVYSRRKGDDVPWEMHAKGRLMPGPARERPSMDLSELRKKCPIGIPAAGFYRHLELSRFHYGPYFQTLKHLWVGHDHALAEVHGHPGLSSETAPYTVHPTLLDATLQLIIMNTVLRASRPWVPVGVERLVVYASPSSSCWAHTQIVKRGPGSLRGNIYLIDQDGRVAVEMIGVHCQEIVTGAIPESWPQWLYSWAWQTDIRQDLPVERAPGQQWLVFGDSDEQTADILAGLMARGITCTLVTDGGGFAQAGDRHYVIQAESKEDMARLWSCVEDTPYSAILYLWKSRAKADASSEDSVAALQHCTTILHLVQSLPSSLQESGIRLGLVTRGCHVVCEGQVADRAGHSLWGMGRVIRNEYPGITCQLLDLDAVPGGDDASFLFHNMVSENPEPEVAQRGGVGFSHRLQRVGTSAGDREVAPATTDEPVELVIGTPGRLDSLHYRVFERREPGPGEVEIRVHGAALNYKDLLKAMGTIASQVLENTYFGTAFGMECSGVIVRVGEGVENVHVGQAVIATTNQGAFRSYVTTMATYVIPKPAPLTLHEAPLFTVFLTAYYALVDVARLQRGERVLIHNAAGGVGLAAVQIAQWLGAEIYATAGNDDKRALLREMGVPYVMDSRTLHFADEIQSLTAGRGIDVVLNAMSGEALRKSFALLAAYGRFIEIGKKDIAENSGLPMETFNRNVSFTAIDLDRIFRDRVQLAQQLFEKTTRAFEDGHFRALPTSVFPALEAESAFRYMAQSKHVGKIVIDLSPQPVNAAAKLDARAAIRDGATYLVTGGTRGFGLEIAKWLVSQGARHLVLLSRSGFAGDETKQAVLVMESQGVQVLTGAVDVSDAGQLDAVLREMKSTMPPLRGIIHGAMVLDDGLINGLTAERLKTVMAPKILGALNLDAASQGMTLDFFVMLSSVSSLVGNIGQANYAAANAFLDGFAEYRRRRGLPATTINWGALAEVGVAARNSQVEQVLNAAGLRSMHIDHALFALGQAIKMDLPQIGIFEVDWARWRATHPGGVNAALFESLYAELAESSDGSGLDPHQQLLHRLAALEPQARTDYMQSLLSEELARVLQMPASQIDVQQNVMSLGIDSLMAVELQTALQGKFALQLSAMELTRGLSVSQLAARLYAGIAAGVEAINTTSAASEETLDALLQAEMAGVSDAEFEQMVKEAL